MKNLNDQLAQVFKWLLLLPAFIPLLYIDGMLYPYLAPKTFLFRAVGILAVALFVYLSASGYPFYFKRLRNKLTWLPAGLLAVAYATSLAGVNFYHSFWSTFDRGDGLLTLTIIVAFFYLVLLSAGKDFINKFLKVTALTGSLVAIQSFLQWLEIVSGINIPGIDLTRGRLGGTLGNAAFLASYLGMTAFITLALARTVLANTVWKKLAYVSAVLQFIIIFLTATRGSIISLLAVGFITLVYLSLKGNGRSLIWARSGLGIVIVFGLLFVIFRAQLSQSSFEPVRRLAYISLQDETVSSRLFLAKHLGGAVLDHPLAGYGAEHVVTVFNREYDPSAILEQWFDRSHNAFIDYFLQYGIVGGLLYVALLILGLVFAWRVYKKGETWGIYIGLAILMYGLQNLFVFDTAVTLWLLFMLIALTLVSLDDTVAVSLSMSMTKQFVAGLVAVCITYLIIPVSIQPMRANLSLADGYLYHVADIKRSNESMEKGLALNTYADLEYGYQAYSNYTDRQVRILAGDERVQAYNFTASLLEKNFVKYAYDARTLVYYAHVLELAPPEVTPDENLINKVLDRAIELSPHRIQPWYLKANIFLRKGDLSKKSSDKVMWYKKGIEIIERYATQEPYLSEPRYILANLYFSIGEKTSAAGWAAEGLKLYKKNEDTARRAMRYYLGVEDWVNMARFMEDIVSAKPDDYDTTYDLAKASFLAGNVARAKELVEHLRRAKPGLVETDPAFMEAIGE
jgi:O-antigen ligase